MTVTEPSGSANRLGAQLKIDTVPGAANDEAVSRATVDRYDADDASAPAQCAPCSRRTTAGGC